MRIRKTSDVTTMLYLTVKFPGKIQQFFYPDRILPFSKLSFSYIFPNNKLFIHLCVSITFKRSFRVTVIVCASTAPT